MNVGILTISDTRTAANDTSGDLLVERATADDVRVALCVAVQMQGHQPLRTAKGPAGQRLQLLPRPVAAQRGGGADGHDKEEWLRCPLGLD